MKRRGQSRGQRFVKADYYELDWYYEECTDGKNPLQHAFRQRLNVLMESKALCSPGFQDKKNTNLGKMWLLRSQGNAKLLI